MQWGRGHAERTSWYPSAMGRLSSAVYLQRQEQQGAAGSSRRQLLGYYTAICEVQGPRNLCHAQGMPAVHQPPGQAAACTHMRAEPREVGRPGRNEKAVAALNSIQACHSQQHLLNRQDAQERVLLLHVACEWRRACAPLCQKKSEYHASSCTRCKQHR